MPTLSFFIDFQPERGTQYAKRGNPFRESGRNAAPCHSKPFLLPSCAFSWPVHLPFYFLRLLFLTAFLPASLLALLASLAFCFAAFTFTAFFTVLFAAFFATLFFAAFFDGWAAFFLAGLAALLTGAFAGFGIITVSVSSAGMASAASISRQP